MPAKIPKLTPLEREIRVTKKQQLSSEGRTSMKNIKRVHGYQCGLNRRSPFQYKTYEKAREIAISSNVQVQHQVVR